jgi:adenosylcobinamide kinase / adenosylcobinamide-phosphate guanylyltransferase
LSVIFVTGGSRSGKSDYAMGIANSHGGRKVYIATATAGDEEMAVRIARHKDARGNDWETIEEPLEIQKAFDTIGGRCTVVLDCLTLWLTNLMMEHGDGFEDTALLKAKELAAVLKNCSGMVIVVTNELGSGIVPENALSRRFRDMAGTVNRIIAEAADEAWLVMSGIPVKLK